MVTSPKNVITRSGVPHGSVCGLFFNIFINDVAADVNCLLYADDIKLYYYINFITDCFSLPSGSPLVCCWCETNSVAINIEKCNFMSFELKYNIICKLITALSQKCSLVQRHSKVWE